MAARSTPALLGLLPGLAALKDYQRAWIRYDVIAGVSVAAVAVPIVDRVFTARRRAAARRSAQRSTVWRRP
jgi:MFS superfamily sulfate permease-like transporter